MALSRTFRYIWEYLRPFRWHIIGLVVLTVAISVLAMLPPLLVRSVINDVISGGRHELFFILAVCMIGVGLLHAFCGYLQVLGMAFVGQTFVMQVRNSVYRHLLTLGMMFHSKHSTGKLINRLMGDSTTLQQILTVASVQVVSDLACSMFAISAALWINWRLALPLILLILLFVLNYNLSIGRIRKVTRSYREAEDRVAGGVQNRLFANLTVKTFGMEDRENDVFGDQSSASLALMRESQVATSDFTLNVMLLRDVGRIVIFFLGCAMVLRQTASYGDVVAFTTYSMQLLMPAVRFSQLAQQFQNVRISADRLFEILDESPNVENLPGAEKIQRVRGRVDFDHVFFSYEPDRPVLKDIDLHVVPGQTVALVGPTGCGKTTILSLLMRLFDLDSGEIRLDGRDIREIELGSLRRQFGIVLQESLLFTVTIGENIRYARPDATREEVEAAARVAEIHRDILELPDGYDSVVGDRRVQLSVGQKQRLAIARAILADPAILVMDEATSALDSASEKAIQVALERFMTNRTAFVVAHRLSTIRNADLIVMLDRGRIVEKGRHEELMGIEKGRYRDLYEKHSGAGVLTYEE